MKISRRRIKKKLWPLVKKTLQEWSDDNITTQAASLAYYTVFSVAPILVIAIAVAGLFFGQEAARGELQEQIEGLVGQSSAVALQDMTARAGGQFSEGVFAAIIGVGVLLFGASGVFAQLQESLNIIWKVKPKKDANGALVFIRKRLLSFAMVLVIGFLLLVSLVVSAGLSAVGAFFADKIPGWESVWQIVNLIVPFGVITFLFAMIYKILPDAKVAWRDVWLGAAVTAFMFSIGKLLIGLYLGKSSVASSYGAAGSFAVLLVWVYYSSMILFLGAEFTQVYARSHGSHSEEATDEEKKMLEVEAETTHSTRPRGPQQLLPS